MDGLAPSQHLHKLFDAFDSSLDLLCVSDPIQNGVAIRAGQRFEHCLGPRVGLQGYRQIRWHLDVGLPGVRRRPPAIRLRFPDLFRTRWMHSARGTQPLGLSHIPLRPRAPGIARCESSPERFAVTSPELPIDPAEANRFVESVVVAERRWMNRSLFGKHEPDAF